MLGKICEGVEICILRRIFDRTGGGFSRSELHSLRFSWEALGSCFRTLYSLLPALGVEFYGLGFLFVSGNFFADDEILEKGFGGFCGVGKDVGGEGSFGLRRRILRRSLSVASSNLAAILEREQRMAMPGTARTNPGITGTGPNMDPTIKSRPPRKIIPQCLAADSFFRVFR